MRVRQSTHHVGPKLRRVGLGVVVGVGNLIGTQQHNLLLSLLATGAVGYLALLMMTSAAKLVAVRRGGRVPTR